MIDASVIAAFLSFLTTVFAAYATWKGPVNAAKLAETMRKDAEQKSEVRRLKNLVFYSLMQERSTLYSIDGVRALNLIDVAFIDNKEVRECWVDLHSSFNASNNLNQFSQDERLKALLKAIAKDLNLVEHLRSDDFSRVYYPNALAQENAIKNLERDAAFTRLSGQSASTNTVDQYKSPFPPRPAPE